MFDKGTILIADRNISLGAVVIPPEQAIFKFSEQFLSKFESFKPYHKAVATFDIFINDLAIESRNRLLSLFGPTTGHYAESLRNFLLQRYQDIEISIECASLADQIETMVKVGSVSRLNIFHSDMSYFLFDNTSRMSHSCLPNCEVDIDGSISVCRAILPIRVGEELTIEYDDELKLKCVPERRRHYLTSKEFTCHCPRCDAIGDDTRQFDCVDPACKGVMMVCQPINNKPIPGNVCAYTGVTYVEPHLLPCTVCHRAAPGDYQTEMFALESMLPQFSAQLEAMLNSTNKEKSRVLLEQILSVRLLRRHSAALPLLQIFCILERNHVDSTPDNLHLHRLDKLIHVVQEYIAALEGILTFPNNITCKEIVTVVTYCCQGLHHFPPAVPLLRKALRMHLIMSGRDARDSHIDQLLLTLLTRCNSIVSPVNASATGKDDSKNGSQMGAELELCGFCKESPFQAALTLSRCSRCKKVTYCSVGCQKAHWKLHKKTCTEGEK